MTIKNFNRQNLPEINKDIQSALKEVEKKHGITISVGRGKFSDATYETKINMVIPGDGFSNVIEKDFLTYAQLFGLSKDLLGQTLTMNGKDYKIIGAKSNYRKYPIIGESRTGKQFKFTTTQIKAAVNATVGS